MKTNLLKARVEDDSESIDPSESESDSQEPSESESESESETTKPSEEESSGSQSEVGSGEIDLSGSKGWVSRSIEFTKTYIETRYSVDVYWYEERTELGYEPVVLDETLCKMATMRSDELLYSYKEDSINVHSIPEPYRPDGRQLWEYECFDNEFMYFDCRQIYLISGQKITAGIHYLVEHIINDVNAEYIGIGFSTLNDVDEANFYSVAHHVLISAHN